MYISQNLSCGNVVPTKFLMWERRSHAFPPHYTTAHTPTLTHIDRDLLLIMLLHTCSYNFLPAAPLDLPQFYTKFDR